MSKRLDRKAWVEAGLSCLGEAGPAAIAIPAIAKRLGVTKGSFYWHFQNLEEFETALLAAWEQQYTKEVVRLVEDAGATSAQRLRHLLELAFTTDTKVARAVRHWSAIDARARRAQRRVDRERVAYIAGLLRDLGWIEKDATTLARWCYWAVIGLHVTRTSKPDPSETDILLRTLLPR